MIRGGWPLTLALAAVFLAGCGDSESKPAAPSRSDAASSNAKAPTQSPKSEVSTSDFVTLRRIPASAGIDFRQHTGAQGRRMMIEQMGAGATVFDFDGDGRQDLYFVDAGATPTKTENQAPGHNKLYRNLGNWRFEDVSAGSGAEGRGYMQGAVVGDYDNDGDPDLYITAYGSNTLLQNQGDGKFVDVTAAAGCDDPRWSTGAAFVDYDRDGLLDLFVQNYLDYRVEAHRNVMKNGIESYAPPDLFDPVGCSLFRNRGDGGFDNVSISTGVAAFVGKGLGVLTADFDDDGRTEIYCANDTAANTLLHFRADGRFEDLGLISGAGYGADGREEAGMGVDAGDIDGDGQLDIVVTNFQKEPNAFYRNEGGLNFTEISDRTGTAVASRKSLGFGVRLVDLDNDGRLDLVVNNGHVYDNAAVIEPYTTWEQAPLLFRGLDRARFEDVLASQPAEFRRSRVGRALAAADLDEDGDLDLILTSIDGVAEVFENVGGEKRAWLSVRCIGTKRDSTAIGARVEVEAGKLKRHNEVRSGGSFLSQSDLRVFFGLGELERVDRVSVRWPDGSVEEARDVPTRRHLVFVEGQGLQPR